MKQRAEPDLPDPFKPAAAAGIDNARTIRGDTDPEFARELAREARRQLAAGDTDLPMRARALRALERSIDRLEDIACDDRSDPADVIAAIRELGKVADIYKAPPASTDRQPINITFQIAKGGVPQGEGSQRASTNPDPNIGCLTPVTVDSEGSANGPRPDDIVIEPVGREIERMAAASREVALARAVPAPVGGTAGYMAAAGGARAGVAPLRRGRSR